jgi:hypothetical protein
MQQTEYVLRQARDKHKERFLKGRFHLSQDRCMLLRHSLMNLNRGQGLGFKVFGTVIDTRFLVKVSAALAGVTGKRTHIVCDAISYYK